MQTGVWWGVGTVEVSPGTGLYLVSLDMLVIMGEVTACVGGGTKEVSEV